MKMVVMSSGEVPHNPFATQYVRPGAIPFLFPEGTSAASLIARLKQQNWRGEILGPHGTGKSTLLHALREPLLTAGRKLVWHELRQGDATLPAALDGKSTTAAADKWSAETLVVVDGAEQLAWPRRKWLIAQCDWAKCGLLWTTHEPLELPLLWETKVDVALAEKIVGELLPPGDIRIAREEIAAAFAAANENLRETLFGLFDKYQQRL